MYVSLRTSSFTNNCENKKKQEAGNNNEYMGSATQEMDGIPVSPRVGMYN